MRIGWPMLISSWFVGCDADSHSTVDTRDAQTDGVEIVRSAHCPDDPVLVPAPISCIEGAPEGLECRYTATGCAPGERPDNVCHCESGRLICDGFLRNCLPLREDATVLSSTGRPIPQHRAVAELCKDPAADVREECDIETNPPGACTDDADCGGAFVGGGLCLASHSWGGDDACRCFPLSCLQDDECGSGSACECGAISGGGCNSPDGPLECSHHCVPAECRTDADCDGGFCSPSYADCCGAFVESWACHFPGRDECLSDAECGVSRFGSYCRHEERGWRCRDVATFE